MKGTEFVTFFEECWKDENNCYIINTAKKSFKIISLTDYQEIKALDIYDVFAAFILVALEKDCGFKDFRIYDFGNFYVAGRKKGFHYGMRKLGFDKQARELEKIAQKINK